MNRTVERINVPLIKIDSFYKQNSDKGLHQLSDEGGTRSQPATPYRLQNPKWPPGGTKWPPGGPKWPPWGPIWPTVPGKVSECFKQLLLNKFFDPSTPSIRKQQQQQSQQQQQKTQ